MGLNVLVVDDSRTMRALIKKILGLADVGVTEVFQAADGNEALSVLDESQIDLVLSDINMPGMNGFELIERMSEMGTLDKIPLIVLSTEGSEERIDHLRDVGIRAFLRKPFSPEALSKVLNEVLGAEESRLTS